LQVSPKQKKLPVSRASAVVPVTRLKVQESYSDCWPFCALRFCWSPDFCFSSSSIYGTAPIPDAPFPPRGG
jgi:hypothetical protein